LNNVEYSRFQTSMKVTVSNHRTLNFATLSTEVKPKKAKEEKPQLSVVNFKSLVVKICKYSLQLQHEELRGTNISVDIYIRSIS
jgi:hypothetical protein